MKSFKDMGIKMVSPNFTGDKIRIEGLLNREITVLDFKIEDSTVKIGTKCLHLWLEIEGIKRVHFSGSKGLMQMIQQIDRADLPFRTTIIKENQTLQFS